MQLFIPNLQSELTLTQPWNFRLFIEPRNLIFLQQLIKEGIVDEQAVLHIINPPGALPQITSILSTRYIPYTLSHIHITLQLPAGSNLVVERIFIRKGAEAFDSITFRLMSTSKNWKKSRFWVKLVDAHNMHFLQTPTTTSLTDTPILIP